MLNLNKVVVEPGFQCNFYCHYFSKKSGFIGKKLFQILDSCPIIYNQFLANNFNSGSKSGSGLDLKSGKMNNFANPEIKIYHSFFSQPQFLK
jgi:hypothetical protein